jgi:tetratricopeptide (TPR) repeat protein
MLGQILRLGGRPAEALPSLERAVRENPDYRDALLELGQCQIQLRQPAAAARTLTALVREEPSLADAHYVLGTALAMLGRSEEAARERRLCGQLKAAQHASQVHQAAPAASTEAPH